MHELAKGFFIYQFCPVHLSQHASSYKAKLKVSVIIIKTHKFIWKLGQAYKQTNLIVYVEKFPFKSHFRLEASILTHTIGVILLPHRNCIIKIIIDVDKCLTKCMSSESMHME